MSQNHQKSGAIQSLRALAIVGVILFHLNRSFAPNGFLGVDMFFVISGYLMSTILTKSGVSVNSTSIFLQRRIKRIVPLYLLTIAGVLVASRVFLLEKDLRILRTDALWSLGLVSNMQPLFHEFDYFEELTEYKLLTHTWSLSTELQYYVFVPLVMLCLLALDFSSRIVAAFVVVFASLGLQIFLPADVGFGLLPCRVWQFFFGLVAFELSHNPRENVGNLEEYKPLAAESGDEEREHCDEEPKSSPCLAFPLSSLLCVLSYLCAIFACYFTTGNPFVDRISATFLAALIIYFSTKGPTPVLDLWILQYIGDISYILYLVHWPVIITLKYLSFQEEISAQNACLALLITITVSVIFHHTIEQTFITGSFNYALAWIATLLAISAIFILLPIQEKDENSDFQSVAANYTKDCRALTKGVPFPKLENFTITLGGYEKAGQDTGNGTFNVLLMGNSFMRFGFPHFYKALDKRYKRLYFHAITSCMPFENSGVVDAKEVWSKNCNISREKDLEFLELAQPKMIFISIGYDGGFVSHKVEPNDTWVNEAALSFKLYEKYADFIVIDTPLHNIRGRIAGALKNGMQNGVQLLPREQSQFRFSEYLEKNKYAFKRIEILRSKCTKCHFIEVQSEFCDGTFCQSYDYDCKRTLYTRDGIHMTEFAKNLLYHRLKAEVDIIYAIAEQKKKRRR